MPTVYTRGICLIIPERKPYWEEWIRTNHSTLTSSSSWVNIFTLFAFLFLRMIFKFSQLHHRSAGLLLLCRDNSAVVIYLCIIIDTHYHFSCPATFWSPVCYGKEIVGEASLLRQPHSEQFSAIFF